MKIWVDLENAPHAMIFRPIVQRLSDRGHRVIITAKDIGQTLGLLRLFNLKYIPIGEGVARGRVSKGLAVIKRSFQLSHTLRKHNVDVSISHGSRSLLIGSKLIGVPTITAYDYEFICGYPLFRLADLILIPEYLRNTPYIQKHYPSPQIRLYPGMKEELYLHDYIPSEKIIDELGIPPNKVIITVRPPAVASHYHHPLSEALFERVMERIMEDRDVFAIVLPRYREQGEELQNRYRDLAVHVTIPKDAVNGLDLMWHSDLVISGGGTMNREAALLGVPVYSIFSSPVGAVDRYLILSGRLIRIDSLAGVSEIEFNKRSPVRFERPSSEVLDYWIKSIEKFKGRLRYE